ncbi:MAG: hypothetical protein WC436_05380 [Candidatus Babeliales bacterium]
MLLIWGSKKKNFLFLIFFLLNINIFAKDQDLLANQDIENFDFNNNIDNLDFFKFLDSLENQDNGQNKTVKNILENNSQSQDFGQKKIDTDLSQALLEKHKNYLFKFFPKVFLVREKCLALMTPEQIALCLQEVINMLRDEPWKYVESLLKTINKQLPDKQKKEWEKAGYDIKFLEKFADISQLKKISKNGGGYWEFIADQLAFYTEFVERCKIDSKSNSVFLTNKNFNSSTYFTGKFSKQDNKNLNLKDYWANKGIFVYFELYTLCFEYYAKLFLEEIKFKKFYKADYFYCDLKFILEKLSGSKYESESQEYIRRYKELLDLLKKDFSQRNEFDNKKRDQMTQQEKYWQEMDEFYEI